MFVTNLHFKITHVSTKVRRGCYKFIVQQLNFLEDLAVLGAQQYIELVFVHKGSNVLSQQCAQLHRSWPMQVHVRIVQHSGHLITSNFAILWRHMLAWIGCKTHLRKVFPCFQYNLEKCQGNGRVCLNNKCWFGLSGIMCFVVVEAELKTRKMLRKWRGLHKQQVMARAFRNKMFCGC